MAFPQEALLPASASGPNTARERVALGFATALTAAALYSVPSWTDSFSDPCRQAAIASAVTILLLYITRWLGDTGIAIERIALAVFLAGMPVVYLERWLLFRPDSAEPWWLAVEILGFAIYGLLAVLGLRRSPWFLAAGIAAHGAVWDASHLYSAYIPAWYAIACLLVDLGLGFYVAMRIPAWSQAAARGKSSHPALGSSS